MSKHYEPRGCGRQHYGGRRGLFVRRLAGRRVSPKVFWDFIKSIPVQFIGDLYATRHPSSQNL